MYVYMHVGLYVCMCASCAECMCMCINVLYACMCVVCMSVCAYALYASVCVHIVLYICVRECVNAYMLYNANYLSIQSPKIY